MVVEAETTHRSFQEVQITQVVKEVESVMNAVFVIGSVAAAKFAATATIIDICNRTEDKTLYELSVMNGLIISCDKVFLNLSSFNQMSPTCFANRKELWQFKI